MSHLNALHVHEVVHPEPPTGWWEEHSTSVITIAAMVVLTAIAWSIWANWEIVRDTVMTTLR
jgi:hypothetical protein